MASDILDFESLRGMGVFFASGLPLPFGYRDTDFHPRARRGSGVTFPCDLV